MYHALFLLPQLGQRWKVSERLSAGATIRPTGTAICQNQRSVRESVWLIRALWWCSGSAAGFQLCDLASIPCATMEFI